MTADERQFDLFADPPPKRDPPTSPAPDEKKPKRKRSTRKRESKRDSATDAEPATTRATPEPDATAFEQRSASADSATPAIPTWTVARLVRAISATLEAHLPETIHVVGEISNFIRHAGSGHIYMSLKDADAEIRAVLWRSDAARVKFDPADGLEVVATGQVAVFEKRGQVQFQVRRLEPRGVGALELAFRQLRERLQREGLFDPARKKPLPTFPQTIAIVTSPTGAAVRDIIRTINRRYRAVRLLLHPAAVQGDGAAQQIAAAIAALNAQADRLGGIDLMIVGRGGGSLEDLWAFNEEPVARAIFASKIPVISAVGHETDVTIADLVADVRAATPTAAAEMCTPDTDDLLDRLAAAESSLTRHLRAELTHARQRLARCESNEWFRRPLDVLRQSAQQVDEVGGRLRLAWSHRLQSLHRRLHDAEVRLTRNRPDAIIARTLQALADHHHRMFVAMSHRLQRAERHLVGMDARLATAAPTHRLRLLAEHLDGLEARLRAGSHESVLHRGFAIARDARGRIITRASQTAAGDQLDVQLSAGKLESIVSKVIDEDAATDADATDTRTE